MSGLTTLFSDTPATIPSGAAPGAGSGGAGEPGTSPVSTAQDKAAALADAEQRRTARDRLAAIQRQLLLETTSLNRGYGLRSLIGSFGSSRNSLLGSG